MIEAVDAEVGGDTVRRTLPTRAKRTIGAWCFADHYGPSDVAGRDGMRVGPHPHTGLQTVSWLLDGEIVHRDSLGNQQAIRPGQLNVMTAGRGIAHSEESPRRHPPALHGTQLWVALPDTERNCEPSFDHLEDLPVTDVGGWEGRVLTGSFCGVVSPARVHTPLLGVDLTCRGRASAEVALDPAFEHGVIVLEGAVGIDGELGTAGGASGTAGGAGAVSVAWALVPPGSGLVRADRLVVLPPGRHSVHLRTAGPVRVLLLGGPPWQEPLVMWWNFVGRTAEDVEAARDDWQAGRRFGALPFDEVPGGVAPRAAAPPLPPGRLVSRL